MNKTEVEKEEVLDAVNRLFEQMNLVRDSLNEFYNKHQLMELK